MIIYNKTTIEQSGSNAKTSTFMNFNMKPLKNTQKNMNESIESNKISNSLRLEERRKVEKPIK